MAWSTSWVNILKLVIIFRSLFSEIRYFREFELARKSTFETNKKYELFEKSIFSERIILDFLGINVFSESILFYYFSAVANSKLWCSADYDFNENKRFIPCADGAFYQGCGMLSKSAHDGQWVTDYGSKVSPRPDPNQDEARGCYSAEYFVCEMMKEGTDGRPMPTEEPPLGPDCLGTGWSGYTTDGGQPSNKCYKVYSWHNEPTANNSIGVDFGEALEWCRAHNADLISLHSREQEQKGRFQN